MNALSEPIPVNLSSMSYLKRLFYAPLLFRKNQELKQRAKRESTMDLDAELCILSPNQMTEFYRTTDLQGMSAWLHINKAEIKVTVYCEVDTLVIRVGRAMEKLLKDRQAKLIIKDVHGEEIIIPHITNEIISNRRFLNGSIHSNIQ